MASIFVFGSNTAGRHGKGAALMAKERYGAIYGQAEGLQGQSYGIPTRDGTIKTIVSLPLSLIEWYVIRFILFAIERDDLVFQVTRIGCGLGGYTDRDIAPMFARAPANCSLPPGWRDLIQEIEEEHT